MLLLFFLRIVSIVVLLRVELSIPFDPLVFFEDVVSERLRSNFGRLECFIYSDVIIACIVIKQDSTELLFGLFD